MADLKVTPENEPAIRAYLARLFRDSARLRRALHFRSDPATAGERFQAADSAEALTEWVETYLSRSGRERLLNSLRVRRTTQDRANWRIPKFLYDRLKKVASIHGMNPEDWLDHQLQGFEHRRGGNF